MLCLVLVPVTEVCPPISLLRLMLTVLTMLRPRFTVLMVLPMLRMPKAIILKFTPVRLGCVPLMMSMVTRPWPARTRLMATLDMTLCRPFRSILPTPLPTRVLLTLRKPETVVRRWEPTHPWTLLHLVPWILLLEMAEPLSQIRMAMMSLS